MINHGNLRLQNCVRGIRYRQHRKEAEQIVRRLDNKRSMEIFVQRSQGSLLQRQIQNKRKTQIKMQQENRKKALLERRKTLSFNPTGEHINFEKRHASQKPKKLWQILDKEKKQLQMKEQKMKANMIKINEKNIGILKKLGIRPALQELQNYLKEQDPRILQRRCRIVEMLVLCLMRRCHRKLYQALDIALQTSYFFQEEDKQILLKSICLKLIGKIYKEIFLQQRRKRVSLQSKITFKRLKNLQKKRHSSFMIKTLTSQRAFLTRFEYKFKQSKLLKETSFRSEVEKFKQESDKMRDSSLYNIYDGTDDRIKEGQQVLERSEISMSSNKEKNNFFRMQDEIPTKIIIKMNNKLAITLPVPSQLFPDVQQEAQNYKVILHQRDIQSTNKLFPYQYPSSIQKYMDKKEYLFLISSINSIIFSETQCYDFLQVFKTFITHIFGMILILIVLMLYFVGFYEEKILDQIVVLALMLILLVVMISFVKQSSTSNIYVTGQRKQKIIKQLIKWNNKYQKQNILFKTTQNCETLIIYWLASYNENLESGSSIEQADLMNQESSLQEKPIDQIPEPQDTMLLSEIESDNTDKDEVILPKYVVQNVKENSNEASMEVRLKKGRKYDLEEKEAIYRLGKFNSEMVKEQHNSQQWQDYFKPISVEDAFPQVKSEGEYPHHRNYYNQIKKISVIKNQKFSPQKETQNSTLQKRQKSKIKLKPIYDIIEVGEAEKIPQKLIQPSSSHPVNSDPEEMCLQMTQNLEKKVHDFDYYLNDEKKQSESKQSVHQPKFQVSAEKTNSLPGSHNEPTNFDKIQSLINEQYFFEFIFDSEEEDQVIS